MKRERETERNKESIQRVRGTERTLLIKKRTPIPFNQCVIVIFQKQNHKKNTKTSKY